MIYWIFGPPAAGKTTTGIALAEAINGILLDADDIRRQFWPHLRWSKSDRMKNVSALASVALAVRSTGIPVVCAAITPAARMRQCVVDTISEWTQCKMIYVTAPMDILVKRDPKGLYANPPPNMTGVSSPFELPHRSSVAAWIDTSVMDVNDAVEGILKCK